MGKPAPESATIRSARVQLRRRLKAVAIERDKLRDIISDYEDLVNSCDDAVDALHTAIEALSRYA
jgi:hypothetical protein